ncbi:hypothetical protein TNCV_4973741 [Trichonephila clavipes]|uniref:Uncharacterized protein n=1 Tax=Trichonephila clavipes TaxID=2585209 RepID=A0A8X6VLI4_TRICX|nr:hypothetical protein TNCV_4973741 [Trichonephila clavipes]
MSGRCTPTDPKLGLRPDHFAKVATTNGIESGGGNGCFPRNRFVTLNPFRVSSVPLGIPHPPSPLKTPPSRRHETTSRSPIGRAHVHGEDDRPNSQIRQITGRKSH